MPTVPVIPTQVQDPVRQAQFSAGGVAQVQPQQPGQLQRIGQQMEQAGQQWEALAIERQRRVDIAAHTERDAAVGEKGTEKISAYRQKQGKAAEEGFTAFVQEIDDLHKAAIESAPEGPQREWLRKDLTARRSSLLAEATRHRDVQITAWRKASAATSLNQSVDEAIKRMDAPARNPAEETSEQDGETVKSLLDVAADKAREMAQIEGLDETATNALVAGTMAQIHEGRVEALLADGNRTGEAAAYFAEHRDEIPAQNLPAIQKKLTAAVLEGTARELTSNFYRFEDRLKWVNEKFQGSADDKESLRRHLMQQQELRDRADAQAAQEVRKEAMQFYRDNPGLEPSKDFPELAERMERHNVVVKRVPVTDDAWVQANLRDARKLAQLRELTPEQRENILAPHLSESDLKKELAFIDGDQHAYSMAEMFDRAAVALGVPLSTAYQGEAAKTAAAQARMRFDAMMNREIEIRRSKKGDKLTLTEIQKEIIDPMLMARNYVARGDWSPERMPLAEAQVRGLMPTSIDDPATEVDESQSFEGAGDFYVETPTARVYLRDITLQQRREIALAWARRPENQGRQMTLQDEAEAWVAQYKPAVDAKKAAEARGSSGAMIPGRDQRGVPPMGPK